MPVISVRSVETHLRMQNKQVVMMGGLYNSSNTLQQQRVPILSDIPFIGELFTGKNLSKEVTQLIFFLKIHIISPEQAASGLFYDPDRNAQLSEKLGNAVENLESFPPRKTSLENLADELLESVPRRDEATESVPAESVPAVPDSGAQEGEVTEIRVGEPAK